MEYKKKQRKEDIDNRCISVAKSKLVRFLVVGIVVLVILSPSQVYAEGTDDLPFEEYNNPPSNPNSGSTCEKGWEWREGQQECVPCDVICSFRLTNPEHYVYDPDKSSANNCECKCEEGYRLGIVARRFGGGYETFCKKITGETEENCEEYCKNQNEHAFWASGDHSSGCVCECEKGWTMKFERCVPCDDICGKKDHYVYDPDLSYNNVCECKCERGYKFDYDDLGEKICKKVKCPENSTNVADLTGSIPTSNDRKLNNNCYCDEGYKRLYEDCVVEGPPGDELYYISPSYKEIVAEEEIQFSLEKMTQGRYDKTTISNDLIDWKTASCKSSRSVGPREVGEINEEGVFTGKSIGTCIVIATMDGKNYKTKVTVKCSENVPGDKNKILNLYRARIPNGPILSESLALLNLVGPGRANNMRSCRNNRYSDFTCGGYQDQVLKFLHDIQYNPDECTLLNNYDFGPIEGSCGLHHAVVIYPRGTDWKTEGIVLDPWPTQTPEHVHITYWNYLPISGETQKSDRTYPTQSDGDFAICARTDDTIQDTASSIVRGIGAFGRIIGILECPVDLLITDSEGRRMGMLADGSMVYEIPYSFIANTPKGETENRWHFELNSKTPNQYNLELMGIDDGTFELLWVSSENKEIIYYGEQSIKKGEIVKVSIDPDNPTAPLILPNGSEIQPTILEPITDIAPPGDPSTPPCTGTSTYAYIESITMQKGKEARIAVMMCNAKDLANMDFSISYNPGVLDFKDAEKGSLNSNSLFESNEISSGNVKLSFASSKGVSGSGSIAILIFNVVGSNGDSSILTGSVNTADTSSGSPISITINPGEFTVGGKKTIYVDDDFTDDPANHKWDTIHEGITDANDGDTVLVYNGRYTETVVLNKRLTLIGEGMPEIDAQSLGDAINIKADNCTVKGFNCVNAQPSPYAGIRVDSSNNVIADNTCNDNYEGIYLLDSSNEVRNNAASSNNKYGIRVQASDGNIISNNTVKENGYSGISLKKSNDNRIADNDVSNNVKSGIWVSSSNNNEVRNNVANSNSHQGIVLGSSTDNTIANNTAKENGDTGIYLTNSNNNRIADNDVSNNEYLGISVGSSNNNEVRNNVANSNHLGIALWSSTDNIISNNTAKENENNGISLHESNDNRIADNDVSNNVERGISVTSSNNNEVRNNVADSNPRQGIRLWNSTDNIISNNTVKNNEVDGISLSKSNNNRIYMNNFLDNDNNVYSEDSTNIWHSPSERTYRFKGNTHTNYLGNYWDDYTGSDTDNDGIGDRSYNINSDNNDNYPLKEPVENYFLPIRLGVGQIFFP